MPWNEVSAMSLRQEFVTLAMAPEANVRQLCRRFGISPKTGYKWIARFQAAGVEALSDRSRRPLSTPTATPAATEQRVLALRQLHPAWGARKLRRRLLDSGQLTATQLPAASTITAILRRHDQLGSRAGQPRDWQRFEQPAPNRLWQMDFKGHFAIDTGRCHPLTILDDHSRYALAIVACSNERMTTVRGHLEVVFGRYGLPERILCDNGPPWGNSMAEPHTELTVWLLRLGVAVSHGRPCHPQTQGKDERFHRTLNVEVIQGQPFGDVAACQRRFDAWRDLYNHQRPHEALALAVPASRYRVSSRSLPTTLLEPQYLPSDHCRRVDADGRIGFGNRAWSVGKAFRGQTVAVRATENDGVWSVYFSTHHIKTLDFRTTATDD
jgi:transposase InsO family protein